MLRELRTVCKSNALLAHLRQFLAQPCYLVFIDGNKREYIKYYEMAMEYLNDGGWILADNTLWDGHVIDPERQDAQTNGVRAFNDLIRNDERVEVVILPLRDGLTIIRKK